MSTMNHTNIFLVHLLVYLHTSNRLQEILFLTFFFKNSINFYTCLFLFSDDVFAYFVQLCIKQQNITKTIIPIIVFFIPYLRTGFKTVKINFYLFRYAIRSCPLYRH